MFVLINFLKKEKAWKENRKIQYTNLSIESNVDCPIGQV